MNQEIHIHTTVVISDKKAPQSKIDAEIKRQEKVSHYMARIVAHYAKKQKT